MIATTLVLQACGCLLGDMRRDGATRQEVIDHATCTLAGCPPQEPVEVRIAWDYDGDMDVDLIDFAEFQRTGKPEDYEWFARNAAAYAP